MNKSKEVKKQKETLMGAAKSTIGLGIVSGAGLGAMGAMSSIMPAGVHTGAVTGSVGAGLGLLNVGRMAKSGLLIAEPFMPKNPTKKQKKGMDRLGLW